MAHHRDTDLLHDEEDGRASRVSPLTSPIYRSSAFTFANAAELEAFYRDHDRYLYSRDANPTVEAAERKMAHLEGADEALVTASGMAAVATIVFGLLAAGDELVCSSAVYGGTQQLLARYLPRFGLGLRIVPVDALTEVESWASPASRVLWFESPSNPTLRCVDIARLAAACRARGIVSVIDSTFATPINQRPLALGVDLVMHSATKYLNGHSDLLAGVVAGGGDLMRRLRSARRLFGGVLDPGAAYELARGAKTLPLRMARHNASALALAEWLATDPRVARVYYPGLVSHPDHAIARAQMTGFGGMVTFEPVTGAAGARAFFDRLQLIRRAVSLGGPESLCSLPMLTSHVGANEAQRAAAGVTPAMVRLSVGLEAFEDIRADVDWGLGG